MWAIYNDGKLISRSEDILELIKLKYETPGLSKVIIEPWPEGVRVVSREDIMEEQMEWDESDQAKNFDFTGSELWIITDDGIIEPLDPMV